MSDEGESEAAEPEAAEAGAAEPAASAAAEPASRKEPPEDPAKKPPKKRPELRASALLMGVPLILFFFLPWDVREPFTLPPAIAAPLLAMGFAGSALVVLAFASDRVRLRGVPIVGGLLFLIGLWLLEALVHTGRLKSGLSHLPRLVVYLWIVLPVFAMGAEMAMHRHPRSRRLAVIALLGWLAVVAVPLLPQRPALIWKHTAVDHLMAAFERERFHLDEDYLLPFIASFIGLIGVLQCLRRIGPDRERAAERRFRSSVLAWLLIPIPTLALTAWMMATSLGRPVWLTKHFYVGFGILACALGGALAVRAILGSEWARARSVKPALAVAVLAILGLVVGYGYAAFVPRGSADDAEVVALAESVGAAVEAGLQGQPVERRWLGNYSGLDLRGAAEVVELPANARRTHVGLRVETEGGHDGYAIVDEEGALGWVALDDEWVSPQFEPDSVPEWLEADVEPSGPTVWDRLPEIFGAPGCRPSPATVPDVLADHLRYRKPACNALQLRALRGPRYVTGWVSGYVVVFEGDGESVAVGGNLTTRRNGAWIGMPRPIEDYPPPHAHEKWVNGIR